MTPSISSEHTEYATFKPMQAFSDLVCLEIDELMRLRDELRLKAHLAAMEGRSAWLELQKHLARLEERFGHEGDRVAETTRQIAGEIRTTARNFKQKFLEKRANPI